MRHSRVRFRSAAALLPALFLADYTINTAGSEFSAGTTGAGALAEFVSPSAAVRCAVEIQEGIASGRSSFKLNELIPSVTKFAFLSDPGLLWLGEIQTRNLKAAADSLGLSLLNVKAHTPDEFEAAFSGGLRWRRGKLVCDR